MKLGELKIETLMLIFPSISIDVDTENGEALNDALSDLKADPNYCDYLSAMTGAINRCFTNLESKGVLPLRYTTFSSADFTLEADRLSLDISEIKGKIERVDFRNLWERKENCDFTLEGDRLTIEDRREGVYTVVYEAEIPRIKNITGANYIIDLPDKITSLMPYFIKSEVIRTDDGDEASSARSLYEAGIAEIVNSSNRYGNQGAVESVFKI